MLSSLYNVHTDNLGNTYNQTEGNKISLSFVMYRQAVFFVLSYKHL